MRFTWSRAVVVMVLTAACGAPAAKRPEFAASMGDSNLLTSAGLTVTFTAGSVQPYDRCGCVKGAFQNATGSSVREVVVAVAPAVDHTGRAPRIAGGAIGGAAIPPADAENRARVALERPLVPGESLRVEILFAAPELAGARAADVFVVKFESGRGNG